MWRVYCRLKQTSSSAFLMSLHSNVTHLIISLYTSLNSCHYFLKLLFVFLVSVLISTSAIIFILAFSYRFVCAMSWLCVGRHTIPSHLLLSCEAVKWTNEDREICLALSEQNPASHWSVTHHVDVGLLKWWWWKLEKDHNSSLREEVKGGCPALTATCYSPNTNICNCGFPWGFTSFLCAFSLLIYTLILIFKQQRHNVEKRR